ncbi:hypothetical protein WMY93_012234 [Mugilogobius chulae]|uniref:N-acetyltransferase domain-containing protein n=1 Tax=Mugilogobius chulae TaxID=88201 RepID=A0AAW0PAY4_9GOBI
MSSPLYLTITTSLCAAGYFLGSWLGAVLLSGLWVSVVYYCCHEIYAGYVRNRLQTDMRDIPGNFMSRPGDCFWVAEAEVEGRAQVLGTVAVVEREDGAERFGELFRMIISPTCRRLGLGLRLTQTVVDFCKERGFTKVVLETSSAQTAAVALFSSGHIVEFVIMMLVIREYEASDKDPVCELFSVGIKEHIRPCFYNAMSSPLYLTITTSLCAAGYFLGSWLGAVLLSGLWVSVVYYCCHEIYAGYVRNRLQTDMRDIPGNFMSRPGDCFWVAEAEVEGRAQVLGTVAVVEREDGAERFGELFRMIIFPTCRRLGLGLRLTQTVVDFCKERGFTKVVLETSSAQTAAVALYKKVGFCLVTAKRRAETPLLFPLLARVSVLTMEKHIQ